MPNRSAHPCPGPQCTNFTTERHCKKCAPFFNKQLHQRCNTEHVDDDFYDTAAWERARKRQLTKEPQCRRCKTTLNLQVDHIKPISQGGSKFDATNHQTLCADCHKSKTRNEDGWHSSSSLIVVCGPPGAGKTTYVLEHSNPWDIIIDHDLLIAAIAPHIKPHGKAPKHILACALSARDAILDRFERNRDGIRAWYVASMPSRKDRDHMRARYSAKVLVMDAPHAVCMQRVEGDDTRDPDVNWHALISQWWAAYETSDDDLVLKSPQKPTG